MSNILINAVDKFANGNYDYGYGGDGYTDNNNNSKFDIDCSHLVNEALKLSGYDIPYLTTKDLSSAKSSEYFHDISGNDVKPGDIVLFDRHVGIVASYDPMTNTGTFFGSQTSTGPALAKFGPGSYWGDTKQLSGAGGIVEPSAGAATGTGGVADSAANAASAGATLVPSPPRRYDPLVLDLDGDGLEFTSLAESRAMFDLSGDKFATRTAWLKGDDGFLAVDQNSDGVINNINELFGSATEGGFAELSTFDSNFDDRIDSADDIFDDLQVWQDINGDGVSQTNELKSLADLDIQRLSLTRANTSNPTSDAQVIQTGTFTHTDGTTGQVGEVLFTTDPTFSNYIGVVNITEEIAALPDLKGYGKMADLRIAMALDSALQETVTQAVANLNNQDFITSFERVLYQWAGVNDITLAEIDSNALLTVNDGAVTFARAGVTLTLKQLGVIKAYSGLDIMRIGDGQWTVDGVTQTSGALYQQAWDSLYKNLLVKFAVATGYLDDMLPGLGYDPVTDQISVSLDTTASAVSVHGMTVLQLFNTDDPTAVTKGFLAELTLQEIGPSTSQSFKEIFGRFIGIGFTADFAHIYDNSLFKMLDVATTGTAAANTINGTTGDDILLSLAGNDTLHGNAGNDVIEAHNGSAKNITAASIDMSKAFIKGVNEALPNAEITFDPFHLIKIMNEALSQVRSEESRLYPDLMKGSRYAFLKNPENLTEKQDETLTKLCNYRLKTARAYLIKLALQDVYFSATYEDAEGRLKRWYNWAIRSQIEQVKKVAKTVKSHWDGILSWFNSHLSNGFIEAINGLIQSAKRRARGYRSTKNLINMAYLLAGKLDFGLPT